MFDSFIPETRNRSRNRQQSTRHRPTIESRAVNGTKRIPEPPARNHDIPTPYAPVNNTNCVTAKSEQQCSSDPEETNFAQVEGLEGNNIRGTLDSRQTFELAQITPTSQLLASDPVSDSSCSFVLSSSSPFNPYLDTDSDDDYLQGPDSAQPDNLWNFNNNNNLKSNLPLITHKSASTLGDSGSLDVKFEVNTKYRRASCDNLLEGKSDNKDPEFSAVATNAFSPLLDLGKQRNFSQSHCEILLTTKVQHGQKSKSVGDFTRVDDDSRNSKATDAPKHNVRKVPFPLQWQASVDNLYGSPRLPRRKQRYHMRREVKYDVTNDKKGDIPGGQKWSIPGGMGGHTQLRVAAIINNMKRSFSDLLHGDDIDRVHTGYPTSTFYDTSCSDDRTQC